MIPHLAYARRARYSPSPSLSRFSATQENRLLTTGRSERHEQYTERHPRHPRRRRLAGLRRAVPAVHARAGRPALRHRLRRGERPGRLRAPDAGPPVGRGPRFRPGRDVPRPDAAVLRPRHRPPAALAAGLGGVGLAPGGRGSAPAVPRHGRRGDRPGAGRRRQLRRTPLGGRPGRASSLAAGPGGAAVGGRAGGTHDGSDIDFSSRRRGC
ncbi:hypothetical protein SGPA1_30200 [Streptomyces misionensis JCM 4497]